MANGLVTKTTDLKSLKYGSMPFGGTAPYITEDINNPPTSNTTGMQLRKRLDDTSRIAQMLGDRPGLKFLANQALLQQVHIADKLDKGASKGSTALSILKNTIVGTAKVALSTLAQIPVNGTGTHFVQGFRTNTYLQPTGGNTRSGFAQFFGAGGVEGAPYALRGETVPGEHTSDLTSKVSAHSYSELLNTPLPEYGSSRVNAEAGKPVTTTGTCVQTTAQPTELGRSIKVEGTDLKAYEPVSFTNRNSDSSTYIQEKKSYNSKKKNITKEARRLLGDQGARKDEHKKSNAYWTTTPFKEEVDKINSLGPNKGKVDGETKGRDLIKFRFHILTADGVETVLYFRAFLDSFADNYSGQWNPVKYLGRAEDFQIYSGFQRKISLSFKIAAATRSEMAPLYEKMIWLASATAPTYTSTGQFMRGTITKITVGDYIYELPGVLNSVNYAWNTEYPWEIAMTEPEVQGKADFEQELPMVMDCSIDFTPVHTFTPTTGLQNYITSKVTGTVKKALTGIGATPNTGT